MKSIGLRYRAMIVLLAVTAYVPTLKTGFMWDDHVMIEANPQLTSWTFANLKHDFTTDVFDGRGDRYYRPLQTILNRVDYTLWGLRPLGYHVTNLLFHLGNTLLAVEVALALGCLPLTAFLLGTLFGVHPIGVEQLMIIAGRAELMGLFFTFLTILLFLKKDRRAATWGWAAFAAALFSKESSVMIPALIALVYYVRREPPAAYKRLVPLAVAVLPYLVWRHHVVGSIVAQHDFWFTTRFFVQAFPQIIARYIGLILVPWNLHSHRLVPHLSHFWPLQFLLVTGAAVFLIKRYPRPAIFCFGWFLLTLLPKTPVMIYGSFMLDHWAYPAAFAVLLPLSGMVARAWMSHSEKTRALGAVVYFPLLIIWALLVHLNVSLRGTDEKMYRWALNFSTSNPVKYNLGVLLVQTGRPAEAARYFEDVRGFYPEDPLNAVGLSIAYWQSGHHGLAVRMLKDFDKQHPGNPLIHSTLAGMQAAASKK